MTTPRSRRELGVRRAGSAYQGVLESVFAILIGAGLGYWADAEFESAPWGLMIGLALGFCAFVLRLVRLARQMQAMVDEEESSGEG